MQNDSRETTETKKRPRDPKIQLTDYDILKKHHKFLRDEQDAFEKHNYRPNKQQYGQILAKKYYNKLFKEYAVIDLAFYQSGKIGCRWRTESQVLSFKCQKICSQKKCKAPAKQTYQINFAYIQEGQKKNALVKTRVCCQCAIKLNFKKIHVKIQQQLYDDQKC